MHLNMIVGVITAVFVGTLLPFLILFMPRYIDKWMGWDKPQMPRKDRP